MVSMSALFEIHIAVNLAGGIVLTAMTDGDDHQFIPRNKIVDVVGRTDITPDARCRRCDTSRWILAISFALATGGFLLPFWPLEVVGIMLLGLAGHPIYAVGLGLLLDLAYGAPTGHLHPLLFPFTALAIVMIGARYFGRKYFFDVSPQDSL